jgi:hypothetical protein
MDKKAIIGGHVYVCMLTISREGTIIYRRPERKRISVLTQINNRLRNNCNKFNQL